MMLILDNPQKLAMLLASLNAHGTKRPLLPIEVAQGISDVYDDLGKDMKETVKRLPVGSDIVGEFLRLLKLPLRVQEAVSWGESNKETGSIGFSVAAKIAKLNNSEDVLELVGTILDMQRPPTKEEIKNILGLKKRVPNKAISECIAEVINVTRTVTIQHFLFITGIKPDILSSIVSNSKSDSPHEAVLNSLKESFPHDMLKDVKVLNESVRLSLDENGKDFITKYAEQHEILRQDVINHMLKSVGGTNDR